MSGAISRPPAIANEPSFQGCENPKRSYAQISDMRARLTGGQKSSCMSITNSAGLKESSDLESGILEKRRGRCRKRLSYWMFLQNIVEQKTLTPFGG